MSSERPPCPSTPIAHSWGAVYKGSVVTLPRSSRSENLTPAKEGSIDTDVLESIEIAREWIFSEHNHVRDLADLERSISILVPGQAVAALRRHPQRLLSGQPTISELPLTVVVPARKRLPRGPQHRIRHSVG